MNIPNLLSLIRLLLIPVFCAVFFGGSANSGLWAAAVFLLAFVTDIADGYIARRFNMITKLGRVLDPLADKLMKLAAVICLLIRGDIALWVLCLLLAKELLMLSGGAVILKMKGDIPSANWFGKCAEGYLCALVFLLIMFRLSPAVTMALWAVALVLDYTALAVYAAVAVRIIKEKKGKT